MYSTHYPFPVASHTYFRALNKEIQKELFLASPSLNPVFTYGYSIKKIKDRIALVDPSSYAYKSLKLVELSARLQDDDAYLKSFKTQNELMFGTYDPVLAEELLGQMEKHRNPITSGYIDEVYLRLAFTPSTDSRLVRPDSETFAYYKRLFDLYMEEYPMKTADSLAETLQLFITHAGLEEQGWFIELRDDATHASVHFETKKISIGKQYVVRRKQSVKRIAIHEVYGHALRGRMSSVNESEGFAVLLEQLTHTTFSYRRSHRYLAGALASGVLGEAMDFRQTFEVMWRVMAVISKYDITQAKRHAFDEVYRVFRGGRPDLPGAVYSKDSVYFKANIAMWTILDKHKLAYDEFKDIIEGRREIL